MSARRVNQLNLAAVGTAARCSRHFVRVSLTKWDVAHVIDDALVVASELVANAVKATGIAEPESRRGEPPSCTPLTLRLTSLDAAVVIEVWDVSPQPPMTTTATPDDEQGRGLAIVGHLAERWGSYPHRGGKVVWAEIAVH